MLTWLASHAHLLNALPSTHWPTVVDNDPQIRATANAFTTKRKLANSFHLGFRLLFCLSSRICLNVKFATSMLALANSEKLSSGFPNSRRCSFFSSQYFSQLMSLIEIVCLLPTDTAKSSPSHHSRVARKPTLFRGGRNCNIILLYIDVVYQCYASNAHG